MFPCFWIKRPFNIGKYSIFDLINRFPLITLLVVTQYCLFFKAWKTIDSLTCVLNFLFNNACLSLLINFFCVVSLWKALWILIWIKYLSPFIMIVLTSLIKRIAAMIYTFFKRNILEKNFTEILVEKNFLVSKTTLFD